MINQNLLRLFEIVSKTYTKRKKLRYVYAFPFRWCRTNNQIKCTILHSYREWERCGEHFSSNGWKYTCKQRTVFEWEKKWNVTTTQEKMWYWSLWNWLYVHSVVCIQSKFVVCLFYTHLPARQSFSLCLFYHFVRSVRFICCCFQEWNIRTIWKKGNKYSSTNKI